MSSPGRDGHGGRAADRAAAALVAAARRRPGRRRARRRADLGVVTRSDMLRALGVRWPSRGSRRPSLARELGRARAPRAGVRGGRRGQRGRGGRLPRRRHRARHPARRAELRRRHRRRGRRDRASRARSRTRSTAASPRTRSSAPPSSSTATDERVDVVTARTEFYDAPAALPTVEHATIREDLFRRDFTINAMAVSLRGDDFGRLVDPFGGRRDLEARDRSASSTTSRSSTTRRGSSARSGTRRGTASRWTTHTACARAAAASRWGSSATCSSARLRDELVALLEEPSTRGSSILRLGRARRRSQAIHPHLAADEEAVGAARARVGQLADEYGLDGAALAPRPRGARASADRRRDLRLARPAEGAPPRRRADRRGGHASRRGSSSGSPPATLDPAEVVAPRRAATRPTRRCSRSRSRTSSRCAATSRDLATSASRSPAPTSPSSGCASRRASARCSTSFAGAS